MISRSATNPTRYDYSDRARETYPRRLHTFPPPERHAHMDLVRPSAGIIFVPENGAFSPTHTKLTKLLLNVNIDRTFGPVQVVMSMEDTVMDLIKAALDICRKEKRRPFLNETNPDLFQLHYSQFSLESLKADDKLISLGSRNFFLCKKPSAFS